MNATVPSATRLMFWRLHFTLALALTVYAVWQFVASMAASEAAAYARPQRLALLGFAAMMVIAPLIAEWGFIRQRGIEKRSFWRLLLLVQACLFAIGTLMTLGVAVFSGGMFPSSFDDVFNIISSLISAGQLWAVWSYAYRSDHLWGEAEVVEST